MKTVILTFAVLDGLLLVAFVGMMTYGQMFPYTCAPASRAPSMHPAPFVCVPPTAILAFASLALLTPLVLITLLLFVIENARASRRMRQSRGSNE